MAPPERGPRFYEGILLAYHSPLFGWTCSPGVSRLGVLSAPDSSRTARFGCLRFLGFSAQRAVRLMAISGTNVAFRYQI